MTSIFHNRDLALTLLTLLRSLDVMDISITFSGSGDSGSFENPVAKTKDGTDVDLTKHTLMWPVTKSVWNEETNSWDRQIDMERLDLYAILIKVAEAATDEAGLDWWNNDGGDGELTMDFSQSPPAINMTINLRETIYHANYFEYDAFDDIEEET